MIYNLNNIVLSAESNIPQRRQQTVVLCFWAATCDVRYNKLAAKITTFVCPKAPENAYWNGKNSKQYEHLSFLVTNDKDSDSLLDLF